MSESSLWMRSGVGEGRGEQSRRSGVEVREEGSSRLAERGRVGRMVWMG